MKRLFFINATIFIVLVIVSCGSATPDGTLTTPNEPPRENNLTLTPVLNTMPEITQVEFLIDNSNSVEDETKGGCGKKLGEGRFDFARFITRIFRDSIPVKYSQNLYIGVSTFGDKYTSLLSPTAVNTPILIPMENAPTNNTRYTIGIQGALSKMYDQDQIVQTRYLVIITDGETETESVETVEAELKKQTNNHNDPNLHIYIALLCPRKSQVWFDKIHHLDVADVFVGLESVTQHLFGDLNGFLPVNGVLILPANNQNIVEVAGYATSVNFSYWTADTVPSNYLGIYNNNGTFSRSLIGLENYPYQDVYPLPGCPPHSFRIDPPPSSNWFLFVQPRTFQNLKLLMKSSNGGSIEIVNDDPLNFQFEISNLLSDEDLSKWKDCFSAQLIWATSNQSNQVNGEVNFVSCEGIQLLCYTETQWSPEFTDMGDMEIKIKLKALDDTAWENESKTFPIKFRAEYNTFNSTPFTVNDLQIGQKDFIFRDVSSTSQIDIYLVSSTSQLDNDSCPNLTHIVNGLKAHQLMPIPAQQCDFANLSDTPEGNRVCISYSNQAPLKYVYTLHIYDRITKADCQYDQLYFKWHSGENTKEITWWCDFLQDKDCIRVSKPTIIPYP